MHIQHPWFHTHASPLLYHLLENVMSYTDSVWALKDTANGQWRYSMRRIKNRCVFSALGILLWMWCHTPNESEWCYDFLGFHVGSSGLRRGGKLVSCLSETTLLWESAPEEITGNHVPQESLKWDYLGLRLWLVLKPLFFNQYISQGRQHPIWSFYVFYQQTLANCLLQWRDTVFNKSHVVPALLELAF